MCFAKSTVSNGPGSFWRELEKLLIDIGFVKMRGTFSSDKIFFKTYFHNSFVAVDITLIFDIEFKWKFLVCENYMSPDIPCLISLPNQTL